MRSFVYQCLLLTLTVLSAAGPASTSATSEDCSEHLEGQPDSKTLGIGSLIRLKPNLRSILLKDDALGFRQVSKIDIHHEGGALEGGYSLYPGVVLRTLSPAGNLRVHVEMVDDPTIHGYMYWWDIQHNTIVEKAAPPDSTQSAKKSHSRSKKR